MTPGPLRRVARAACAAAALWAAGDAAAAESRPNPPRVSLEPAGPAEPVFRHAADACDGHDIPDAPARAFRGADGGATLFAAHWRNRRLRGPGLLDLRPDCVVVLQGSQDPEPRRFDDRLWIAATWTPDGRTVHALVHSEYHGHSHPGHCATARYLDCWYNAVTQAVSVDGGRSFRFERSPPPVIAAPPYKHDPGAGRPIGFVNPTNIVRHAGGWIAMAFTEGSGAQARGNCLLRTPRIADHAAWRAWGGTAFDVAFADPYAAVAPAEARPCQPVGAGALDWAVNSLSRHEPSGAFIAVMVGARARPSDGAVRSVILASASLDLVRWSTPTVVQEIATPSRYECGGAAPLAYPSLLDPRSADRNFETVGATASLFMTRFNLRDCKLGMDRDLLRLPVSITVDAG